MYYDSGVFDTHYSDIFLNYDLDKNAILVQLNLFILSDPLREWDIII